MILTIRPNARGAPVCGLRRRRAAMGLMLGFSLPGLALAAARASPGSDAGHARPAPAPRAAITSCLPSGDGYLRARIVGEIDADVDWPNSGTVCDGEPKATPAGLRMSFRRAVRARPDLVFVFGLTGVHEGKPLIAGRVNLTVFDEGRGRVYGTEGDSRCTIDSLSQRRLGAGRVYRVEARGFCTEPAHAVRGRGDILVSRFDFAGQVNYANL